MTRDLVSQAIAALRERHHGEPSADDVIYDAFRGLLFGDLEAPTPARRRWLVARIRPLEDPAARDLESRTNTEAQTPLGGLES